MIKLNEVREGNWIKLDNAKVWRKIWDGKEYKVDIDVLLEISSHEDYYSPIELTSEILTKCGFDWSIYHQAFHKEGFELDMNECYPKGYALCRFKRNDEPVVPNILYLHQLQNVYYSLTGSELEVVW